MKTQTRTIRAIIIALATTLTVALSSATAQQHNKAAVIKDVEFIITNKLVSGEPTGFTPMAAVVTGLKVFKGEQVLVGKNQTPIGNQQLLGVARGLRKCADSAERAKADAQNVKLNVDHIAAFRILADAVDAKAAGTENNKHLAGSGSSTSTPPPASATVTVTAPSTPAPAPEPALKRIVVEVPAHPSN